jgi:hypothetical protein
MLSSLAVHGTSGSAYPTHNDFAFPFRARLVPNGSVDTKHEPAEKPTAAPEKATPKAMAVAGAAAGAAGVTVARYPLPAATNRQYPTLGYE